MEDSIDDTETGEIAQPEKDSEPEIQYDAVEQQVAELHNNLDMIKQSGEEIGKELQQSLPEPDSDNRQRHEALIHRAFLLQRRVEQGDRAIVRGE